MGLYDTLTVKYKLPGDCPSNEFQTKDLECKLFHYILKSSGQLWRIPFTYRNPVISLRSRQDKAIKSKINGVIQFYTYIEKESGNEWWEYKATFEDGKVQSIELIDAPKMLRKE